MARTIPNIGHLLQPLEELLRTKIIPSLTGRAAPSDLERELLALPARLGLRLPNPSHLSTTDYSASMKVTQPLVDHIIKQDEQYGYEILQVQLSAKAEVHKSKREQHSNAASTLKDIFPPSIAHAMDLSQEKGASTWLSVLQLEEYGFAFHKGAFRDALALRYGWSPANAPQNCACGTHFSVEHVLSCPKGGYPSIRHNEIRDLTAAMCMSTEPHLQPMTGEVMSGLSANIQDGARLDIAADGFGGSRFEQAFFDVKVFNPYAPSNQKTPLSLHATVTRDRSICAIHRLRSAIDGSIDCAPIGRSRNHRSIAQL